MRICISEKQPQLSGVLGVRMQVALVNDRPVNIVLDM